MMKYKLISFVLLIILSSSFQKAFTQPEEKLGNWFGVTSSMKFDEHWNLFLQGELRTWEMVSNLNEVLWRIAPIYNINEKYSVSIGYVRVDTWPYDGEPYRKFYENRFFSGVPY